MNALIKSLYLISVGVFLLSAFHAALMARSSVFTRACWVFSVICLTFVPLQICNAMQVMARDEVSAMAAHKWVNFFSVLVIPMLWYFVASLENSKRSFRIAYIVAAFAALILFYNYSNPNGYRFASTHPNGLTTLPWGEQVYVISGDPSWASHSMRLVSIGLMCYIVVFSVRFNPMGTALSSRAIWFFLALMLVSTGMAALSDSGVLKFPYLGGFGFLFLAASYSVLIRRSLSDKEIEERRISHALQHEVQGHTFAKQQFQHVLINDPLTGLPNRAGALIELRKLLAANTSDESKVAVFLFDVDRLGIINGTHGHGAGDWVLTEVTRRLQNSFRDNDLIARVSSDGFLVVASGLKSAACVEVLYKKISSAFDAPFHVADSALHITSSTGLAVFPDDAEEPEEMLAAVELALHSAKICGPGSMKAYRPAMKANLQEGINFESALKEALQNKQLFLCYQPQVVASDGRTACMEALLRWQHPTYGLVMPDRFIPLAESMGLIASIGAWVIDTACDQLAHWHAMGYTELRIAVNLSAQQLLVSNLEQIVAHAIERAGIRGGDLELEITESVLMQDPKRSIERLGALRKLGIRLSIDDFGTGYSSLSYLRVLPVDAFKLDRSFVRDICNGGKDLEICAAAIGLAKSLGLEIVAEGVETEAQEQQLRTLGCHLLQGYYFARPLTVDAANGFLTSAFKKGLHQGPTPLFPGYAA